MAEDFLPATPKPLPSQKSPRRVIAVWVVLIAMFVAIYASFDETPSHGQPAHTGYPGWSLVLVGAVAALCICMLWFVIWQARGTKRFNLEQRPALDALSDGNYAVAEKLYAELAQRYRTWLYACAVATYNRAYTLRLLGEPDKAIGLLVGIDRTPRLALGEIKQLLAVELASCFALGGDTEKAATWVATARERIKGVANPAFQAALAEQAAGMHACRAGRWEEALAIYDASWRRLEGNLPVARMREAYLLRAYAITQTSSPREGASAETWLRLLRVAPPGALAFMVKRWPELETFAITQGVGSVVGAGGASELPADAGAGAASPGRDLDIR